MLRWLFVASVVLSAFLLFLVQPLIGRFVLPWFGGSHVVWTTCLLFFQATLLAGYAYAHLITSKLGTKAAWVHLPLLVSCLLFLPLIPSDSLRPQGESSPVWGVLLVLTAVVGLPYFTLSTTGPLLQAWFARLFPTSSPYRLFALSNLGSLIGLFAYPFLVEPWLTRTQQAWAWSAGFVGFALACAVCAWRVAGQKQESQVTDTPRVTEEPFDDELAKIIEQRRKEGQASKTQDDGQDESRLPLHWRWPLWIMLALAASLLLVATTSQLSQEVAVVPFLWTMPLGLYLLSFVICFDRPIWYLRPLWVFLALASLCAAEFAVWTTLVMPIVMQILLLGTCLFACCMVCHGELARLKPDPKHLTGYYLCLSLGGALGGFFCAVIAPLIFIDFWELGVGYLIVPLVLALTLATNRSKFWSRSAIISATLLLPIWALVLWIEMSGHSGELVSATRQRGFRVAVKEVAPRLTRLLGPDVIFQSRDEYGVLTVYGKLAARYLFNGRIMHGMQLKTEDERFEALSYYSASSGMALAIDALRSKDEEPRSLRLGIVGLGTGVGAAHAQEGDSVVFYEIHPKVEFVARKYFGYLEQCEGSVDVRLGDARMSLERELATGNAPKFDLIAVDAFSSDAIPQHLLTREAFQVYEGHLADGGILAIHVSNRFLQLGPVVRNIAQDLGLESLRVYDQQPTERFCDVSDWVLVARDRADLERVIVTTQQTNWTDEPKVEVIWTDDFGSLWQVLRPTTK